MTDVVGVGKAIDEMGKQDGATMVVGTSLVSVAASILRPVLSTRSPSGIPHSPAMHERVGADDPQGETPTDGISLNATGYHNLKLVDKVFLAPLGLMLIVQ
jgi:hypothetical protein